MQYMVLIYEPDRTTRTPEEWAGMTPAYHAYTEGLQAAGVLRGGAALADPDSATTVRVRQGKRSITDGPFTETKEFLGGYYLLECATLDEALEHAAACPGAGRGSIEVRPVLDFPPPGDGG
jgi:hypothetical protein